MLTYETLYQCKFQSEWSFIISRYSVLVLVLPEKMSQPGTVTTMNLHHNDLIVLV